MNTNEQAIYMAAAREGLAQGIEDHDELNAYILQRVRDAANGNVEVSLPPAPRVAAKSKAEAEVGMTYAQALAQARIAHPNMPLAQVESLARAAVLAGEKDSALATLNEQVAKATDENGDFNWDVLVPESAARQRALEDRLTESSDRAAARVAEAEKVNAKVPGWDY